MLPTRAFLATKAYPTFFAITCASGNFAFAMPTARVWAWVDREGTIDSTPCCIAITRGEF